MQKPSVLEPVVKQESVGWQQVPRISGWLISARFELQQGDLTSVTEDNGVPKPLDGHQALIMAPGHRIHLSRRLSDALIADGVLK